MKFDISQWEWIEDSGHAWLKVTESEVYSSRYRPTEFSYRDAGCAYLEEDLDACEFIAAVHATLGKPVDDYWVKWYKTLKIPERYIDGFCFVRNLPRYKPVKSNT